MAGMARANTSKASRSRPGDDGDRGRLARHKIPRVACFSAPLPPRLHPRYHRCVLTEYRTAGYDRDTSSSHQTLLED